MLTARRTLTTLVAHVDYKPTYKDLRSHGAEVKRGPFRAATRVAMLRRCGCIERPWWRELGARSERQ